MMWCFRKMVFWVGLMVLLSACTLADSTPQVVYVTATAPAGEDAGSGYVVPTRPDLSPVPDTAWVYRTPDPPRFDVNAPQMTQHIVQSGDILSHIATTYGISLDALLAVNNLENPDSLYVGQVIRLPGLPTQQTPELKLLPDSRFVRGPGSGLFDVAGFISQQPGYIRLASDAVRTSLANNTAHEQVLTAAQIVERVSLEYSIDPRLILALLEYRAGWLSQPTPGKGLDVYPIISTVNSGGVDRSGLYHQLEWAADQLNYGYYGWKYRGWMTLELFDGTRFVYSPGLNAGTVGLQYFFSLFGSVSTWLRDIDERGFYRTYYAYFGDPFADAVAPLVPPNLPQPAMTLPFALGETWYFTGGPHGGWGGGSAWAAVDFAPPDESDTGWWCFTSDYWVRAVAPGVIARSGGGVVVLDLDGDGDEGTGWTILYLHLATDGRIPAGSSVGIGDAVGRASCEGGVSTATHLHIARRYNGEWIPADCLNCSVFDARPRFKMGDWSVVGMDNMEYQGYLVGNNRERRVADQGRTNPNNQISW